MAIGEDGGRHALRHPHKQSILSFGESVKVFPYAKPGKRGHPSRMQMAWRILPYANGVASFPRMQMISFVGLEIFHKILF